MSFKQFFQKSIVPSFFVTVTCITLVMAVVGTVFEPDVQLGYGVLFSPFVYGVVAALIQMVSYSKNELTVKQAVVRKVAHFVLLEAGILLVLYWAKALTSAGITIALAFSIFVVYVAVTAVLWLNDKRTTETMNKALKELQKQHGEME